MLIDQLDYEVGARDKAGRLSSSLVLCCIKYTADGLDSFKARISRQLY